MKSFADMLRRRHAMLRRALPTEADGPISAEAWRNRQNIADWRRKYEKYQQQLKGK